MPAEPGASSVLGEPLALSRHGHDRAGHRRTDSAWLADVWPSARVMVVTTRGEAAVLDTPDGDGGERPAVLFLSGADVATAVTGVVDDDWPGRIFLGVDRGPGGAEVPYFAVVVDHEVPPPGAARWANLRDVGADIDGLAAGLSTSATALVAWHGRNPFCPRCGAPTVADQAGWTRRCTVEGIEHFPRTDPAVIMLVHDGGDRCVLGRQAVWPPGRFSVLAGFVEAGEPLEAAVVREVGEEVGIDVTDVRYVASQPWPFPQSLMIGCTARATTSDIVRHDDEIAEAHWFTRAEVASAVTWEQADDDAPGVGPGGALKALPGPVSIARQLLDAWVAGEL